MKKTVSYILPGVFLLIVPVFVLAGGINLPKTGQTTCYDEDGLVIDCTNTGQDGDIQAGAEWPSPRFTDNNDGTVTDNLTGLMWLADANCFGSSTWQGALDVVADFNTSPFTYNCNGYTANYVDWRLPNVVELESLVNAEKSSSATWLNTQGFANVQSSFYWSGTTYPYVNAYAARIVEMEIGWPVYGSKIIFYYTWPVRSAQSVSTQTWQTGQTACYDQDNHITSCAGTGQDGEIQAGVEWPSPRFTDNNDGTATDNLTGLIWLKNADCFGQRIWSQALTDCNNLTSGSCGLSDGSVAGDWRLPNRKELLSLVDYSRLDPALPQGHLFENVQLDRFYWSATTKANYSSQAWLVLMNNGSANYVVKSTIADIWPVRSVSDLQVGPLRHSAERVNLQIGAAVRASYLDVNHIDYDANYGATHSREFNITTPGNAMKFAVIHPRHDFQDERDYEFDNADIVVNYAEAEDNNIQVRGHTLVWHSQLPPWLTEGDPAFINPTREELIDILRNHIQTVVNKYKGRVAIWDVVNEAISDKDGNLDDCTFLDCILPDGINDPRESIWRGINSDDDIDPYEYVRLAFHWAREADPNALLFYNDYDATEWGPDSKKFKALYALMDDLTKREPTIPIDGVGFQMHVKLDNPPSVENVVANMEALCELELEVQITELDVAIPDLFGEDPDPSQETAQAQIYRNMLHACLQTSNCSAFTMWGFTDEVTWIPDEVPPNEDGVNPYEGYGAPLIFDKNYQRKPAYDELLSLLENPGDSDFDHDADGLDLTAFLNGFIMGVCGCICESDLNRDGYIDQNDLAFFAANFGR